MSKSSFLLGLAALVLAVVVVVAGTDQPKTKSSIMRAKLDHAQKLLEGVSVQNFEMIAKNANELVVLSKRAEWGVLKTPDYTRLSDDFRRNATAMESAAKEKNLDAAALAYVRMTMNCVDCHKHVREARVTWLEPR